MLADFLTLEIYYGRESGAMFAEEAARRYGSGALGRAVRAGDLTRRCVFCGPDCGRVLFWLTAQGRRRAAA
jgi:hypothetical protein